MPIMIDMLRTWLHIAVGVGVIAMVFVSAHFLIVWHRSIQNKIEKERKEQGRKPWTYQ